MRIEKRHKVLMGLAVCVAIWEVRTGGVTLLLSPKPVFEVQDRNMIDARGQGFQETTDALLARVKNGDEQAMEEYLKNKKKARADFQKLRGETPPPPTSGEPGSGAPNADQRRPAPVRRPPDTISVQDFIVEDLGGGSYNVQLDNRLSGWVEVIPVVGPATIAIAGDPASWSYTLKTSAHPNGLGQAPADVQNELPVKNADYFSLVGQLDGKEFQVGLQKVIPVPKGAHVLKLRANIPPSLLQQTIAAHRAVDGFSCSILLGPAS